jgi:hypothetical protein
VPAFERGEVGAGVDAGAVFGAEGEVSASEDAAQGSARSLQAATILGCGGEVCELTHLLDLIERSPVGLALGLRERLLVRELDGARCGPGGRSGGTSVSSGACTKSQVQSSVPVSGLRAGSLGSSRKAYWTCRSP